MGFSAHLCFWELVKKKLPSEGQLGMVSACTSSVVCVCLGISFGKEILEKAMIEVWRKSPVYGQFARGMRGITKTDEKKS